MLTGGNTSTYGGTHPETAVNGVATFGDLSVRTVGTGYKLTAKSAGLTDVPADNTFGITPGKIDHFMVGHRFPLRGEQLRCRHGPSGHGQRL